MNVKLTVVNCEATWKLGQDKKGRKRETDLYTVLQPHDHHLQAHDPFLKVVFAIRVRFQVRSRPPVQ